MESEQEGGDGDLSSPPKTPESAPATTTFSPVRFLYTQNPFYLISCFLIIYGLQSLAISSGNLLTKSVSMTGGIAAYTALMVVISILVVRCCRVWQDARSIFLVVLIGLVAMSTGFDELCISNNGLAVGFAAGAGFMTILSIETVLRVCRVRLSRWYRMSMYAMFSVFIATPLLLGRAVATRIDGLANWGSVLFSVAIAVSLLLLIPAVRSGAASTRRNGTPWSWPLYPLSAFFVLVVLACVRTHAIWISFGFYGVAGKFEPFLLLPIVFAVIWLITEYGLGHKRYDVQSIALYVAPVMLLCGVSNDFMTWLPIQADLRTAFGSGLGAALLAVISFYGLMVIRRVRHAEWGIPGGLMLAAVLSPIPPAAKEIGLQPWMFAGLASLCLAVMALRQRNQELRWLTLTGGLATTIIMAGYSYNEEFAGWTAASVMILVSMMLLGGFFDSLLAEFLRSVAATGFSIGTIFCAGKFFVQHRPLTEQPWPWLLIAAGILTAAYCRWVRRRGWIYLSAVQVAVFLILLSWGGYQKGKLKRFNWPISSGVVCLAVGLAITTGKSGVYRRWNRKRRFKVPWSEYKSGF